MTKLNQTKKFQRLRRELDKKAENSSIFDIDTKDIKLHEQLSDIQYLMSNVDAALRLQIDNLVLTYGIQALRKAVNDTDLKTIKQSKKVA